MGLGGWATKMTKSTVTNLNLPVPGRSRGDLSRAAHDVYYLCVCRMFVFVQMFDVCVEKLI